MPKIWNELFDFLIKKGWTLSAAESCTGGLFSSTLCALPGTSKIFLGSVVAYSNKIKSNVLRVPLELLNLKGAVSDDVALSMAIQIRKIFESDVSVSMSGIAGPDGGSQDKPVGTVCFGIAGPNLEKSVTHLFQGDRHKIQKESAEFAAHLILKNF